MADVEKMFHQVKVQPSDCDALRFLWWEEGDLTKEVVDHQMLVHLFGATPSLGCASFALKRRASDKKTGFDGQTKDTVNRNFFVDDCLKSVPTVPEACRLVTQLTDLLAKGGFRLTKWLSNCREVLKSIPASERAPSVRDLDFEDFPLDSALGTQWDVERSPSCQDILLSTSFRRQWLGCYDSKIICVCKLTGFPPTNALKEI